MKKKIHSLTAILFFSILPLVFFSSCDKDTNCYLDVLVLDEATRTPVSGVVVELYQNNCDPTDYNYNAGVTNGSGIYSTHFGAPAILSIRVSLPVASNGVRYGYGTVRLLEGETKTAEVTLSSQATY